MHSGLKYDCSSLWMMVQISSGRFVVPIVLRETSRRHSKATFVIRELAFLRMFCILILVAVAGVFGATIEKSS